MSNPGPARVMAIETSCDETACAVIEHGRALIGSTVASQMDIHARYGGIFPEVASRQHVLSIMPVVEDTLARSHLTMGDIDALAVTRGPGLAGSLVVGVNAAKGLALGTGLPLVGVNHLEGHLYSAWVYNAGQSAPSEPQFPLMVLLVSGGHTELDLMTDHLEYRRLGSTLDDAAGEAFDKVARILEAGYPGGPAIQKIAEEGDPNRFRLPRAWLEDTWNFSFSGLKTAVLREAKAYQVQGRTLPVADMAASFQGAVVDVLFNKTMDAAREFGVKEIIVAGGVSANQELRRAFQGQKEFKMHIPPLSLCTDNAAMIAAAGFQRLRLAEPSRLDMDVLPTWPLA
ncbi:MAG TPA: tRNA (adenosine(37)-N6)-threonylcarbamoyltransferase complex transferase subunit TsaD [Anaerolineales bacterium]|nr:tRNA (adenosine(37)-N6)-threonylcarbamoyltransferase complex transferase subunit TsaD [Anaerolineales bacterium]